jgi:ribonuclease-3 family protein
MDLAEVKQLNTDVLAYVGDAVYELFVRELVLDSGRHKASGLHRTVTGYVNAHAQAAAIRGMFDKLSEDEKSLVKRARNHKFRSKAKNADPLTYKWATGFEAFIGYLYLAGEEDRLTWAMYKAVEITDGKQV